MKKTILYVFVALALTTVGIYWWVDDMVKEAEEDKAKTTMLVTKVKSLFQNNKRINDYPYSPDAISWGNNYLLVTNHYSDKVNATYATKWNEELNTEVNYPGTQAKGVIVMADFFEVVGEYTNTSGDKQGEASRHNYILYYLDIDKEAIIAIDTLLGYDPPARSKSMSGHDSGKPPSEDDVIKSIKKRLP